MSAKRQTELRLLPAEPPSSKELRARAGVLWKEKLLPAFEAAVNRVTPKEAAFLFETTDTYMDDAIHERARKGPRLKWLVAILIAAPEATRAEIVGEINRIAGYKPPERARELSLAEEFRIYRGAVRRMAPAVDEMAETEVEES